MQQPKSEVRRQKAEGRIASRAIQLLFLLFAVAAGVTLRGVVLDAVTGQPVSYAAVSVPNLDRNTFADSAGSFTLGLDPGLMQVAVEVSRVGYEKKQWERVDVSRPATFYLRPQPVRLDGISVSAYRSPTPLELSGPVTVVERDNAPANGRLSVAELLWVSPSVALKDYGNLATIGLRGANAEQTLVLFDGVKLNSSQDNLFDLTTMPLTLAQRVEVVRGGSSALYGANSIGGLINISPPEPERLSASGLAGLGSFGKRYLQVSHTNWSDPLGYVVAGSLFRTGDSFPYRDTVDSARVRVNSDISSQDIMAKGVFAQDIHRLSLLGDYNITRRGEPGPTTWPADSARMEDHRGMAHFSYELQEADNARLESKLFHHESWRHYWNPDTLSWINDTHATTVSGATLKQTAHLYRWLAAVVGLEGEREQFRSTAIGAPVRLTGSGWAEARFRWNALDFVPMARFDWLNDTRRQPDSALVRSNTRVINPKLSLSYSSSAWLGLYASVGRSFRAPTFNELFWPKEAGYWPPTTYITQGNPRLRPEWATSVDFNASGKLPSFLPWRLGLWRSFVTDLIQWQTTQQGDTSFTQPVNLDTATITGAEAELGVAFKHAGATGNITYMLARSHGMDLIYRPRISFAVSHWAGWDVAKLSWDVRYTGQRYVTPDTLPPNSANSLPGFLLFDVGLAFSPRFGPVTTALRGGVRNLFDHQREVMRGYPVPGRNWYAELSVSF